MPAVIPPKPTAGALVDADWGGDVHERIYAPDGAAFAAPQVEIFDGVEVDIPLNPAVQLGNPAFYDAATGGIKVPAGLSGQYTVLAICYINFADATQWGRFRLFRNGSSTAWGCTIFGIGGIQSYGSFAYETTMADAESYTVKCQTNATASASVFAGIGRISWVRRGGNIGSSLFIPDDAFPKGD